MAWFLLLLFLAATTEATPQALDLSPDQARSQPDQAQVRVLGRVVAVSDGGRSIRVEADGMTFVAEVRGAFPLQPVRAGDRVFVVGVLRPEGRVLIQTLQRALAQADRPLVGSLLTVDRRARRLSLKVEMGDTREVGYSLETTFVRLGRRSRVEDLVIGDRLWIDLPARGSTAGRAVRIEVIGGVTPEFSEVGEVTRIDRGRRELRVRFDSQIRVVDADRAIFRSEGAEVPISSIEVGTRVRVSGLERDNVLVARTVDLLSRDGSQRIVTGRVQSVDSQARALRLVIDSLLSITMRVRVPETVTIQSEGRSLTLRNLRPSDRVRVTGRNDPDGVMVATRIERLP